MCTRTNAELIAARKAYAKMFDKDLMTTVTDDTSGDLQKLLLMVLQATQDERVRSDEEIEASGDCAAIAQKIFNAIDGIGTDEGALIRIVCKQHRSYGPRTKYQRRSKKSLVVHRFSRRSVVTQAEIFAKRC